MLVEDDAHAYTSQLSSAMRTCLHYHCSSATHLVMMMSAFMFVMATNFKDAPQPCALVLLWGHLSTHPWTLHAGLVPALPPVGCLLCKPPCLDQTPMPTKERMGRWREELLGGWKSCSRPQLRCSCHRVRVGPDISRLWCQSTADKHALHAKRTSAITAG